ncbi:stress-activated map kinase interacting protein 1-domain-containing protein [Cyathus striatus]|nr:stress-activated map kinase interacting protein 1-domain-containing protein [Cyathus striatus]
MSLISDTDFLIHSLRLAYLREVEDPYASRVISLDPSYQSNPYIAAASLADENRWPELLMPSSPNVSDDDQDRPLGFPRARLKYTQTIMGGKSGGAGLRVSGKRMSTSKRMSASASAAGVPKIEVKNFVTDGAPVQEALSKTATEVGTLRKEGSWVKVDGQQFKEEGGKEDASNADNKESQPDVQVQGPTAVEDAPVQKVVPFIPKFKGAAEMAARRRVRLAARQAPGGSMAPPPPPQPQPTLSFDTSSEEEEDEIPPVEEEDEDVEEDMDDEEDDFGDELGGTGSMGEEDEFDPEFAANRSTVLSSSSDLASVLSGATNSISNSSVPLSASKRTHNPPSGPRQPRRNNTNNSTNRRRSVVFEMVTPPAPKPSSSSSARTPDPLFAKKKIPLPKPAKSALSAMLASSASSSNPFTEMYAAISGRGEAASTTVQVYFPHAKEPAGKPMTLGVRKDATVEEVIGFALWSYWEDGWLPKLDDGVEEESPKLSAVGWILRIAEEDGEVDDDFPPPDRMGKIAKFNSEAYAILEATTSQIQQNQVLESKIQRRPSRITSSKKPDSNKLTIPNPAPSLLPNSLSLHNGTPFGSVPLSTSLGRSSQGPQIFLRIHTADAVHISTTIPVSAGMYMQEALEMVARKRKLNPKDYALLLSEDKKILIPLDRTVASLQGKRELLLVKRSLLQQMGLDLGRGVGRTTDPNASIFKRMSDTPQEQYSSPLDFTTAYKKYTIYRKMPMLVARQERTLAVDGVYVHIMPSSSKGNKAMFDSGKTASYHIKSIADCQQSSKTSSTFKLVLNRGAGSKRYDFEADNPKLATEIVQTIRSLKAALERSGTVNKSRRSRQIV